MGVDSSSEKENAVRFESGLDSGFEELVARLEGKLYSLCLNLTHNDTETEEVMGRVYGRAIDEAQQLVEKNVSMVNWIFRSAIDEAAEQEKLRDLEFQGQETLIMSVVEENETANTNGRDEELLQTAVRNLPYEYRAVYLLHDMVSFSIEDITSILEISDIEARAFLHRARVMVCRSLRRFRSLDSSVQPVTAPQAKLATRTRILHS